MLLLPATPQKAPNKIYTLPAPSSFVWSDLVKSEIPYSTNKKRFELKTNYLSHLGNTYVPYHLVDLTAALLEKTGWGGANCSYLPLVTRYLQSLLTSTRWAHKNHRQQPQRLECHMLGCENCAKLPKTPSLATFHCIQLSYDSSALWDVHDMSSREVFRFVSSSYNKTPLA